MMKYIIPRTIVETMNKQFYKATTWGLKQTYRGRYTSTTLEVDGSLHMHGIISRPVTSLRKKK